MVLVPQGLRGGLTAAGPSVTERGALPNSIDDRRSIEPRRLGGARQGGSEQASKRRPAAS